jgi:hypothetical protein
MKKIEDLLASAVEVPTKITITPDHEALFSLVEQGPVTFKGGDEVYRRAKAANTSAYRLGKRLKIKTHKVLDEVVAVTVSLQDGPKRPYTRRETE